MAAPECRTTTLKGGLKLQRISLDSKIQIANGGSGRQIPHRATGKKDHHAGFPRCIANLCQCMFLRGTQACL